MRFIEAVLASGRNNGAWTKLAQQGVRRIVVSESSQAKAGPRRRLRLGMVGGGQGAFIGGVHRIAARLDGRYELVAGALSSTAEKSKASGVELGIDPARCYGDFAEMAKREARRKDGIDVVAIVTPNNVHFPAAKAFLDRGIHVICDKPLTTTLKDARKLAELVEKSGCVFALTHNYTGYPMVRQARQMVADGQLGTIRVVQAEYAQDWLTTKLEDTGQKQAGWRTDPARSGPGRLHRRHRHPCHEPRRLHHRAAAGKPERRPHHLHPRPRPGRQRPRHAALRRWGQGHAVGEPGGARQRERPAHPGLWRARVDSTWAQEDPNYLHFTPFGQPPQLIRRGGAGSDAVAGRVTRIPAGHPEGYLEGFATLYNDAAELIWAKLDGREPDPAATLVPTVADGVAGVKFIEAVVEFEPARTPAG